MIEQKIEAHQINLRNHNVANKRSSSSMKRQDSADERGRGRSRSNSRISTKLQSVVAFGSTVVRSTEATEKTKSSIAQEPPAVIEKKPKVKSQPMKVKSTKVSFSPFSDDQCMRNMVTLLCQYLQGDLLPTNRDILVLSLVNRRMMRMVAKFFKASNGPSLGKLIKHDHTISLFL